MNKAICVHPENPHYFFYKGSPVLLITSAEHYGGVINKGFDYKVYFDALKSYRLNYTRIYCGAHSERSGMFIGENPLAPNEDQLIMPWARSDTAGYIDGGNLFDLDTWDTAYFHRLHDFISEAEKRDIIVEVCLFNAQYPLSWPCCPMNAINNTQHIGNCSYFDVQSCVDLQLLEYQLKYVDKITREVNGFDNVILEIIDEPTNFGVDSRTITNWISMMADTIVAAENDLGRKHLVAQQLEVGVDFTDDPRIDIVTSQYAQFWGRQVGGLMALAAAYIKNKPIELNETAWLPIWYTGDALLASRIELWEFMIGGGAGFNQLNGFFTVNNPTGKNELNDLVLKQMRDFVTFINSFDFIHMSRDDAFIVKSARLDAHISVLSEIGRQYVVYIHHACACTLSYSCERYVALPGTYIDTITVRLPEGRYTAEWIDPADAHVLSSSAIEQEQGEAVFTSPCFTLDIALKIVAEKVCE